MNRAAAHLSSESSNQEELAIIIRTHVEVLVVLTTDFLESCCVQTILG